MARTKRSAKLDTRNARLKLPPEVRHQEPLGPGRYLAYRRPKSGAAGSWLARWSNALQERMGIADDYQDSDGIEVLTYAQASAKAGKWFETRARLAALEEGGELIPLGPYKVSDAIRDYLEDAELRGIKGLNITRTTANAHILPTLGGIQVTKLTRKRIQAWHLEIANTPRRKTGKAREKVEHLDAPVTEDEKRARKDTSNRILTILKAALNLSLKTGKVGDAAPWREVTPFREVGTARARFLSVEDQCRLVNVCPPDFRALVQAALFTGCRYGELTRVRVQDFDSLSGTLFIEKSKSGKSRTICLTPEAIGWFRKAILGKASGALILTRQGVNRTSRKNQIQDSSWGPDDQKYFMEKACEASGVEPLGFHELRHTYASGLVNKGVPLANVRTQLGHSDTRMVEKFYGHLCPSAHAEVIRRLAPTLGIASGE